MKIIDSKEFDLYWKNREAQGEDERTDAAVKKIISEVRANGDGAVHNYAAQFDRSSPQELEIPLNAVQDAADVLRKAEPALAAALEFSANNIQRFSHKQREQFADFEFEMAEGLFTGQRVIPVERAALYVPAGRFPLFSTVLMGLIPAFAAGVDEVLLVSPPMEDGLPDKKILGAAGIAAAVANNKMPPKKMRVFAMGGAQAIAALAIGTETVPRVDIIAGPGNKYVAAAKRILFGETGIDFIAGPSDVLVISDGSASKAAALAAADMIAQAEHDPEACARALVPSAEFAEALAAALEQQLKALPFKELPSSAIARSSLASNGLIVVYHTMEDALRISNTIAPEHLELHTGDSQSWVPLLKNYGSLFIGSLSAEVLGDYSAGINHTLPTSGSARFTGGLSVRHFLKTVTTLRAAARDGFAKACGAARAIAGAEGLEAHALSAELRLRACI
ncbi:MAG: histidinol dehydrogenase [Treponema sp.]|nr:histidinol dehydrogenase [Treponema sp.]